VAEPVAGIDVSRWQGTPNWAKVAATGVRFVYIKGSEGVSPNYQTTAAHHSGAVKAGLVTGLYHYSKPELSATANADAFAAQVNRYSAIAGHLPPCLDLEEGAGNLSGWCDTFFDRLRERTGCRRVMLYSGTAFFNAHIGEGWMDPDVVLWIAHYGKPPGKPGYLSPRVAIHQYSATGRVDGVAGDVDMNSAIWPLEQIVVAANPPKQQEAPVVTVNILSDSDVRRVADAVLDTPVTREGNAPLAGEPVTLRGIVGWFDSVVTHAPMDDDRATKLAADVAAIRAKLEA